MVWYGIAWYGMVWCLNWYFYIKLYISNYNFQMMCRVLRNILCIRQTCQISKTLLGNSLQRIWANSMKMVPRKKIQTFHTHANKHTHTYIYIYIIYTCSHAIYLCLATLGPKSPGLGQHSLLSLFLTPLHSSRSNQSRDVEDWDRRQPKEFARTL